MDYTQALSTMEDHDSTGDQQNDNNSTRLISESYEIQDPPQEHEQPPIEKSIPPQTTIPIVYAENSASADSRNSCDDDETETISFDHESVESPNHSTGEEEPEEPQPEARISDGFRRGSKTRPEGRDGTTTAESISPGAVAVSGNSTSNQNDNLLSMRTTMMVEATAVEEIVATEVIAEPLSPDLRHVHIQQVAIDDDGVEGDDPEQPAAGATSANQISSTTDEKDDFPPRVFPPLYQIILVFLILVIIFVLVCCAIVWVVVPSREEIITEDQVEDGGNPCILAQQETQMHLGYLMGIQWIEIFLGLAMLSTLLYHFLDICQDEYCAARANPEGRTVGEHFFYNMVSFILDVFWFATAVALVIFISLENLKYPADSIREKCISRSFDQSKFLENLSEYLDSSLEDAPVSERQKWRIVQMGNLSTFVIMVITRIPVLLFVLIARGRLILKKQSCQHIALFWRRFWFWLKVLLEVVVFTVAAIGTFTYLRPVVKEVDGLDLLS